MELGGGRGTPARLQPCKLDQKEFVLRRTNVKVFLPHTGGRGGAGGAGGGGDGSLPNGFHANPSFGLSFKVLNLLFPLLCNL